MDRLAEFLEFRLMVTPGIVRFGFVFLLGIWILGGVIVLIAAPDRRLLTLLGIVVFPVIARVWLEAILVNFMIHERLRDIEKLIAAAVADDEVREI